MIVTALVAVAAVKIRLAQAFRRLRQELRDKSAGPPVMTGLAIGIPVEELGNAQPDPGRDLLGLPEVDAGDILERSAVERHAALIGMHATALVARDGHNACSEEFRRGCCSGRTGHTHGTAP